MLCNVLGECSKKIRSWLSENCDYKADVVVVGYGGAGACAAIAAHDCGAEVLVLEKAPFGGGNTSVSAGGIKVPNDLSKGAKYFKSCFNETVDEETITEFTKVMLDLPEKLESLGAGLVYSEHGPMFPTFPGSESLNQRINIALTEEQRKQGMKYTTGKQLFEFLEKQVEKRDIEVLFKVAVKELLQDPNTKEILGVKAEHSGEEIYIRAKKGVILACGGFETNKEMLLNHVPYISKLPIYPYGTPYNTGDGIMMATQVGAKLWNMYAVEIGPFAPKVPSEEFGVGFRLNRRMPEGAQVIYVNKYGKRFMNESILLSHRKDLFKVQEFNHDLGEYPNIPFYMIFDEAYRTRGPIVDLRYGWWKKLYNWSEDNSAEIEKGWIIKADTISELAEKIKVDPDSLNNTVNMYNEYCKSGQDIDFGRDKKWLAPLNNPPFYATELCEPLINTQGGPKRNAKGQVLNNDDKPIPRLFSAGELGSFFSPFYEGSGNIAEALAFGFITGENAATLDSWE